MKTLPFSLPVYFSFLLLVALPVTTQQKGCGSSPSVDCTTLVTPPVDTTDVPIDTRLEWTAVNGEGIQYVLKAGLTPGGAELFSVGGLTTNTYTPPEALPHGSDIYVTITPIDAAGTRPADCAVAHFTTAAQPEPPACTQIKYPAEGAGDVPLRPLLQWDEAPGATDYILRAGSAEGEWNFSDARIGNVTSFNGLMFPYGATVRLTVIPLNADGAAADCEVITFTTKEQELPPRPACSELIFPVPGAAEVAPDATLNWSRAEGNVYGYKVRMGTTTGQGDIADAGTSGNRLFFRPENLLPEGSEIFVTITPYNEREAENCTEFNFTVHSEVPETGCANFIFPKDGATSVSLSDTLSWEPAPDQPAGYILQGGTAPGRSDLFDLDVGGTLAYPAYFLFYDMETYLRVIPYNAAGERQECNEIRITTGSRPEGAPRYIRRNIAEMPPGHPILETFREGIRQMRARDGEDHPLSWTRQAKIHEDHCTHQSPVHGTWQFLPWHRAYLYYMEDAIRLLTGEEEFALPYWDWMKSPQVPDVFLESGDNPLRHADRDYDPDGPLHRLDWYDGSRPDRVEEMLSEQVFTTFASGNPAFGKPTGRLEAIHNAVHRGVGGDMVTTNGAPLDPIFYCHHSNVDRLWAMWNQRGWSNPADNSTWARHVFRGMFFNRDGQPTDVRMGDLTDTRAWDYRYDTQTELPPEEAIFAFQQRAYYVSERDPDLTFVADALPSSPVNQVLEQEMAITNEEFFNLATFVSATEADEEQFITIHLQIDSILPPMPQDFYMKVFINCDYVSADTPDSDPHHAGNLYFFRSTMGSHEGMDHDHSFSFLLDLMPTLRKLREQVDFPTAETGLRIQLIGITESQMAGSMQFSPGRITVGVVNKVVAD